MNFIVQQHRPLQLPGSSRPIVPVIPSFKFEKTEHQTRRKLWDLSTNLHCSILGTCLSASELRKIVVKIAGVKAEALTDHEIHQEGVRLASRLGGPAKLLHKALDHRHEAALRQFAPAHTPDAVLGLWSEARARGDIPGAYWAALTHPATDLTALRKIFGDVHMLSHLVGSANRADVRRLAELEAEVSKLRNKIERQEARIRTVALERDERIRAHEALVMDRLTSRIDCPADEMGNQAQDLRSLVERLEQKLDRERTRRKSLEAEKASWQAERLKGTRDLSAARASELQLSAELKAVEGLLQRKSEGHAPELTSPALVGITLLYVGGRTHLIPDLAATVERTGATFLHHDGGMSDASSLLPGLIGQAQVVCFPLDCVSHNAALIVKKLCKQAAKPYLPLPRSGIGSMLRALEDIAGSQITA